MITITGKQLDSSPEGPDSHRTASYPRENSLSLGALLGGVGRPPRDEVGEGLLCVEGLCRLFLAFLEDEPLLFSSLPSLFFPRR